MLAVGTSAHADATLTLTPVSSQCFWRQSGPGPGGVPYTVSGSSDCTTGFVGSSRPMSIQGAADYWMQVVYDFTYSDDGLPLEGPTALGPASTSFEAGLLSVQVDGRGYNPSGPGITVDISATGNGLPAEGLVWSPPIRTGPDSPWPAYYTDTLIGSNDQPDDISGRITLRISTTAFATQDQATITNVAVLGSVAAVPEPSTWALSIAGMVAVAFAARRRQRVTGTA